MQHDYSREFRQKAVERMNACDNIVGLARELGVCRRVLYNWRDRFNGGLNRTAPKTTNRRARFASEIRLAVESLANDALIHCVDCRSDPRTDFFMPSQRSRLDSRLRWR